MLLDEERAAISRQIGMFETMIEEIDHLLEKPQNGFDPDLAKCLHDTFQVQKSSIKGLVGKWQLFLKQMNGMELACNCRKSNHKNN